MATRKQWSTARINPTGSQALKGLDKRVKLTDDDRARILALHKRGEYSQRELARAFGVSRKLIQLIISPERLAHHKALYKARRADGRYYNKEKNTLAQRKHRAHLREINPELTTGSKPGDAIREINARRKIPS